MTTHGSDPSEIDDLGSASEPDSELEFAEYPVPEPPRVSSASDLRRMVFLISVGLFISSIGQPGVIGLYPFRFLLKNQFHFDASQQANFFAIASSVSPFLGW